MRNALPHRNENSIMNLDNATGPGTHWIEYAKRNNRIVYFDNFDNLRLPKELVRYFGNDATTISHVLSDDQIFCEQMCLQFLQTIDTRKFKKLDEKS